MNLLKPIGIINIRTVAIKSSLDSNKYIWPNTTPKSIPYDGPPTKYLKKRMKKGQEKLWLDTIERKMKYKYDHTLE